MLIKKEKNICTFFSLGRMQGLAKQTDVSTFIYRLHRYVHQHDKQMKHSTMGRGEQSKSSTGIPFFLKRKIILASQRQLDGFNHRIHIS